MDEMTPEERTKFDKIKKLSWEGFIEQEVKQGFYVIVNDTCDLCRKHLIKMKDSYITSNITAVELILESQVDEARELVPNFKAVPFTAYYKNNEQIDFRHGELYDDQLQELAIVAKTGLPTPQEEEWI
jgi:hypothetical protein